MTALLKVDDLAAMLNVTVRTVQRRRAAGTLEIDEINIAPPGDDRAQPRFRLEDVQRYLNERKQA